jgi:prolyl-tRNA editing enzyme YbaK/EbsC (Cys-tRNA(Pro) deacylase)
MIVESTTQSGPHQGLLIWLAANHVEYELREHPETFTAEATARAEHLDPRRFAKVVGVAASDGRHVLLVVDAADHVDLAKARRVLAAADARLLTEAELTTLTVGCEPGTVPPIPALYGLPVYVDFALRDTLVVAFHAGSHRFAVHVDRIAWEHASGIAWADIAEDDDAPAWAK